MNTTQTGDFLSFYPDPNYEYSIKTKKKFREDYRPFTMVGKTRNKKTRKEFMDIFDRLISVSKAAELVFNEIRLNTDPETGIAVMSDWQKYNNSQRSALNKKLTELRNADLVLKLRPVKTLMIPLEKNSYMINPHLLIPWNFESAKKLWKAVKATYKPVED
jgi:predicted MPP superfamily phosphohydrolase